jgi:hypothetical protein
MNNYTKLTKTSWYRVLRIVVIVCLATGLGLLLAVWAAPQETLGEYGNYDDIPTYMNIEAPMGYVIVVSLVFPSNIRYRF